MTVRELWRELGLLPLDQQDLEVVVNLGRNELANGCPVFMIEVVDAIRYNGAGTWHSGDGKWVEDSLPDDPLEEGDQRAKLVNIRS